MTQRKIIGLVLALSMLVSLFFVMATGISAADSGITEAQGWFESAYAEWAAVSGADGYNAYVASAGSSSWTKIDSQLIRDYGSYYRVDAVGLKAGSYQIKIVPTSGGAEQTAKALTTGTLKVEAHDRSGYAHFNYTDGVGAYNDDGTLKSNAIVLYVTNENKNTVTLTYKGTTVTGIGNILGSTGMDVGGGLNAKGGKANTNQDILRKLAADGVPLVVRIIGDVTAYTGSTLGASYLIDGLTAYDSIDYGGTVGDNGYMARMSGGKDITIEGIGFDAAINGWGFHFICQTDDYTNGYGKSFEVRNLTFKNVPEDCVGMEGQQEGSTLTAPVERCWVHNCTFLAPSISNPAESDKDGGDGACDFKRGNYMTMDYCYYEGYHKTNLIGSSNSSLQYHITWHHNYYKGCEARGPLVRNSNIHIYNTIFENQTSYAMNPRADAYIFSEYNSFVNCKNPVQVDAGAVKSYNDSFTSCIGDIQATVVTDKSTQVSTSCKYANFDTNSTMSYIPSGNYKLDTDYDTMLQNIKAYAGVMKENVVAPEDVNTSKIPTDRYPTAAVTLPYSQSLNKTYVSSNGTKDNIVFNVSKFNSDSLTVGGNANGFDIVFYVAVPVTISMTEVSGTYNPVLCAANGEELITGSGSVTNVEAGYYYICSSGWDPGSSKYKEAKIASLSIEAYDPNATPVDPPTPPVTDPDTGDSGSTGGTTGGDSGTTGGGSGSTGGGTVTIPEGGYKHSFTESGKTSDFFAITGNTSTSKGSVTYAGLNLTTCLKMESSTDISFTAPAKGTLTLVFGGSTAAGGKKVKIDGESCVIGSDGIYTVDLEAGSHIVKKGESINLFYMMFIPEQTSGGEIGGETHTHSYTSSITTSATCTSEGVKTLTCSCGDSYREAIPAKGHNYSDGSCVGCGASDPNYNSGGDTTTPDGGDTTTPDGGDSTTPDGGDTTTPDGGDTTTPDGGDTTTPDGGDTTTPDGGDTTTPDGGDSTTPDGGDTTTPDGGDTTTPDGGDTEAPDTGDNEENPDEGSEAPNGGEEEPEEKLTFFQRLWRAIVRFFRRLFGKKN